jgi:hypothetical protein
VRRQVCGLAEGEERLIRAVNPSCLLLFEIHIHVKVIGDEGPFVGHFINLL